MKITLVNIISVTGKLIMFLKYFFMLNSNMLLELPYHSFCNNFLKCNFSKFGFLSMLPVCFKHG